VEGTRGERRLEVTIISVSSLPKMDGMFGKCDPFAVLLFDGVENRTETKKNTYEAEWNETFFLDVMAAEQVEFLESPNSHTPQSRFLACTATPRKDR
jgi:hypothetical protein